MIPSMKDLKDIIHERLVVRDAYKKVFESEEGKIVLAHMMKSAGIPKKQACTDAQTLLVQEGKQFMVYNIFYILNKDPQVLVEEIEKQYKEG